MTINAELPRYRCHKEVHAVKIKHLESSPNGATVLVYPTDSGYAPIEVTDDWFRHHKPEAGGYLVVYEDGYRSYSPAAAFEGGYTRIES